MAGCTQRAGWNRWRVEHFIGLKVQVDRYPPRIIHASFSSLLQLGCQRIFPVLASSTRLTYFMGRSPDSASPAVSTAPLEARKKGTPLRRAVMRSMCRMTADEARMPATKEMSSEHVSRFAGNRVPSSRTTDHRVGPGPPFGQMYVIALHSTQPAAGFDLVPRLAIRAVQNLNASWQPGLVICFSQVSGSEDGQVGQCQGRVVEEVDLR